MTHPSTSSISIPFNPIRPEQPLQVEATVTYMDSDLFKAAQDGDIEPFDKYQGDLRCLVDGRKNTALNIYFRIGGHQANENEREFIDFVKQLVNKCPSLLLQPNDRGEVPLHTAARQGHYNIVKVLIELAKEVQQEDLEKGLEVTTLKQMLSMRDKDGNTAMHKAVESGKPDMVQLLVKELHPDVSFSANKSGETPLYIAVKTSGDHLVAEILKNCKSTEYGVLDGSTALYAVVMACSDASTKKLIDANKHLTKKTYVNGRTPLHYAALYGYDSIAELLLEADASAAYITDEERGMTALHFAAWGGREEIMNDIISHCPGCCEIVDKRGWNFLHIAALTLDPEVLERFLLALRDKYNIKDLLIRNLVNEKDVNRNTPLDLLLCGPVYSYGRRRYDKVVEFFGRYGYQDVCKYPETLETEKYNQIQQLLKDIVNDTKVTGLPIPSFNFRKLVKKLEKGIAKQEIEEKARESHLLVATLVATVTFAAAFTVPGGYNEQQGTATLIRNSAFKAFVMTNTLAFAYSLLAITLHFILVMFNRELRTNVEPGLFRITDMFTFSAMLTMAIAFITGTYAVLQPSSGFAIATLVLGLIFFYAINFLLYCFVSRDMKSIKKIIAIWQIFFYTINEKLKS